MQCTATHVMQHYPLALETSLGNVADAVQGNSYKGINVAHSYPCSRMAANQVMVLQV